MKLRIGIGIILVVASMIKLACVWNLIQINWLERATEEPWAPFILIVVGTSLIYDGLKSLLTKREPPCHLQTWCCCRFPTQPSCRAQ